jgi:hypothetical protein
LASGRVPRLLNTPQPFDHKASIFLLSSDH